MSKRWMAVIALIMALTLSSPLMADKGGKKGKGNPHEQEKSFDDHGRRGDRDDDRWEHRGGYEYRVYERGVRPPGWSQGRKTGWGDCGLPPGQAKKYGCRTYVHEGRRYYFYEDDHGRVIVRRPTVRVHIDIAR